MTRPLWTSTLLLISSACSDDARISGSAGDALYAEDAGDMTPPSEDEGATGSDMDDYEPETEDDLLALKPATTPEYVFVANPDRNTVTRIAVPGLAVITTEVGENPTSLAITPSQQTAVTFNMDSNDLSIIDAGTLEVQTVAVRAGRNRSKRPYI